MENPIESNPDNFPTKREINDTPIETEVNGNNNVLANYDSEKLCVTVFYQEFGSSGKTIFLAIDNVTINLPEEQFLILSSRMNEATKKLLSLE